MKLLFHKKFDKFIKNIKDEKLYFLIKDLVFEISKNPHSFELLEHPFRKYKIRKCSFNYQENSYRIAFTCVEKEDELAFLLIDSRENFYEKLKRMV